MFEEISQFSFPTTIVFGCGSIRQLPRCLAETGIQKPLLVTDPGIRRTDVFQTVESVLNNARVPYQVFAEVHGNPLEEDLLRATELFKSSNCDGTVGLGGGSALDVAKAVVVKARYDGPLTDLEAQAGGAERMKGPFPPMIAVPTTAGTGSEVGRSSVITAPQLGRKIIIFGPHMMPKRAILDPELTVSLPPHLTAATGMDAFTHCLESLTCPVFHPLCDAIALHGLELVIRYLERATRNGRDIEARGYMQIAAMMGAIAFQKDLGATHSLAHPLSTEFGLHHGLANALCLPAVMRFNRDAAAEPYARLAGLFGVETQGLTVLEVADRSIEAVEAMIRRLGISSRLRDFKIPADRLAYLSQKAFEDSCHLTNIRSCAREDLLRLYEQSW